MGYSFDVAIESTHKYAVAESGDVSTIVDLPDGGIALVVVDGQGSGVSARALARSIAGEVSRLLAGGAMATTAAMAASETLFFAKSGKVSVSLDIVRIGRSGRIDIARFSTNAMATHVDGEWHEIQESGEPAGRYERQQPVVYAFDAVNTQVVVIATDGVAGAGRKFGREESLLRGINDGSDPGTSDVLARRVIERAMALDNGRPGDDMTVAAMLIRPAASDQRMERQRVTRVTR